MKAINVNFESREAILESFDKIADTISHSIQIKVNEAYYRIVDFEFYCYSENFPDPHTYKHPQQLQSCKFYLHASGVDITFGDDTNYGGILLRSIVKMYDGAEKESGFMKQQFDGPQIVATELFSNLNPLNSNDRNEITLIDIQGHNQDVSFLPARYVLRTKRVGLTSKAIDTDDLYRDLPLRYIMILPKFKQRTKGIEGILGEKVISGELSAADASEILGYNRNF